VTGVAMDTEFRIRRRQDSAFFFWTRIRNQNFVKNRTRSHFSISAAAGVGVIISSGKTWVNFGWIDGSRIPNIEQLSDPDPKTLEEERSQKK